MNKITEVKSSTRAIRWLVFFVGLLGFSMNGSAQQEVSGTVTNAGGMALAGVTVSEKNSQNSVRTNELGYYSISLTAGNALVYSHVGYKALELNANQTGVLNATLQEDIAGLDEVVVVGYGTQKKGDLTSAVVSVKAKDFLSGNVRDAADLIRSKVAGLNITKGSGAPGDASQVTLRGLSTLQGSTAPLILIDGVVGDFSTVAPENIESIDVLKDASAAAIYGTRGANGVILITTRKGSRGETMAINYHTYAALSNFFKTPDFMDATDVRNGLTAYEDLGSDTDWLGEVTQRGITQNHSFNVQGGAANTTYSANVTLRNEKGVMKTTDLNSIKTTVDLTHFMLDDKLKININLVNSSQNSNITTASMADLRSPFRQAVIRNPTAPIYEADGTYAEDFNVFQYYNPVALLNERNGDNRNKWYRLTGNITAEPITGWKTNLMLSRRNSTVLEGFYDSQKFYTSIVEGLNGSANRSDYDFLSDNLELTTSYDRTFGGHSLNLLGGYSYLYNVSEGGSMFNFDFPTDVYSYHNISAGQALKDGRASVSSYKNNDRLVSFFARVNYSYKNKYSLMASVRREGSSKFGSNNKWGTFPAISAGWNVNQEEILKDVSWLDNLKVRGGYGVTGVIPTSSYLSLTRYNYSTFYYDQGWKSGLDVVSNPNPDLKWEKSAELNIGLDFSLFSERFNGSFDFYNKNTKDMLWEYNVPLPPNRFSSTLANVGRMRNRGLELMLNVIPVKREHTVWSSMVTASHNTNQLVSLSNDLYQTVNFIYGAYAGDPVSVPTHRFQEGQSFGNYWGLKSVGVTDDGIWLIENPRDGEVIPFTQDMLNDSYRQYLGNGIPKLYLGWTNTLKYKSLDMTVQLSSQLGFHILNEQRMFYENNSIAYNKLKSAADLVYGTAPLSPNQSQTFVSYYLENGNFAKLDNFSIGYTFPMAKASKVKSLRLYLTGQNLFVVTKYSGLDPELTNGNLRGAGLDPRDKYPSIRSFTFGLNLGL